MAELPLDNKEKTSSKKYIGLIFSLPDRKYLSQRRIESGFESVANQDVAINDFSSEAVDFLANNSANTSTSASQWSSVIGNISGVPIG